MEQRGCLAIWTRIEPAHLLEYRRWLSTEHIAQRLDIEGVRSARVFTRDDDELSHFILYNVDSPTLFQAPPYLEVLNNPTPWTKIMMPRLRDFDRAVGTELLKLGQGAGGFVTVARLGGASSLSDADQLSPLTEIDGFATLRLYQVDRAATDLASSEKTMRAGAEGQFGCLMVAEAMTEGVTPRIFESAAKMLGGTSVGKVQSFHQTYMLADADRERIWLD